MFGWPPPPISTSTPCCARPPSAKISTTASRGWRSSCPPCASGGRRSRIWGAPSPKSSAAGRRSRSRPSAPRRSACPPPPRGGRRREVPHLVRAFTEEFCRREEIPVPAFRSEALALLLAHDFPGNVRELQNLVEGAVSLAEKDIDAELVRSLLGTQAQSSPEPLDLENLEKRHISRVLKLTAGNKSEAAKILGIDRKTLQRKGF